MLPISEHTPPLLTVPRESARRRQLRHVRALACLLVGVGLALVGANIVRQQHEAGVPEAVLWYGGGIALAIIGIWGTYRRGGLTAPAFTGAKADAARERARWRLA